MSDEQVLCWREAVRACMLRGGADGLARHVARLSEDDRSMIQAGSESEGQVMCGEV